MAKAKGKWSISISKFDTWRKRNNITVISLMKNLGVSRNSYYLWLNGECVATLETQNKMKKMMNDKKNFKVCNGKRFQLVTKPPRKSITKSIESSNSKLVAKGDDNESMPIDSSLAAATASIVINFMTTNSDSADMTQTELLKFIKDIKNTFIG